jgi:hypothetical protein
VLRRLSHPNIITAIDFLEQQNEAALVFEYCCDMTLQSMVKQSFPGASTMGHDGPDKVDEKWANHGRCKIGLKSLTGWWINNIWDNPNPIDKYFSRWLKPPASYCLVKSWSSYSQEMAEDLCAAHLADEDCMPWSLGWRTGARFGCGGSLTMVYTPYIVNHES